MDEEDVKETSCRNSIQFCRKQNLERKPHEFYVEGGNSGLGLGILGIRFSDGCRRIAAIRKPNKGLGRGDQQQDVLDSRLS